MKNAFKKMTKNTKRIAAACGVMMVGAIPAFAESNTPSLNVNFDVTQLFSFAQTMIDAMLPVVYVTLGISLGFLIIRSLKSAFAGY